MGANRAPTLDRDAEALRGAIAERVDDRLGKQFVDYLAEQGLSREDAGVVVARLVHDLTVCTFDALRAQAAEQGVAFDGCAVGGRGRVLRRRRPRAVGRGDRCPCRRST